MTSATFAIQASILNTKQVMWENDYDEAWVRWMFVDVEIITVVSPEGTEFIAEKNGFVFYAVDQASIVEALVNATS